MGVGKEEGKEEERKCKQCGIKINAKHTYCFNCNEIYNTEIAVINKFPDDLPRTVGFFKVKLLDMFRKHNRIIFSFTKNNSHIADIVIKETNYFYLQEQRFKKMEKVRDSEIELIKAPLKIISAVVSLKKDREERKVKWYD